MGLEAFSFITSLVQSNPAGSDGVNAGDDHIRGVKKAVQDSFPNIDAAVTATPAQLNDIAPGADFVGMVAAFPAAAPSSNWLLCDGQAVSRVGDTAALFALLGVNYGLGDGGTTFNLPDYRGEFLRGTDNSAGNDPDAAERTDRGDGTTGDAIGTKQDHAVEDTSWAFDIARSAAGSDSARKFSGDITVTQTGVTLLALDTSGSNQSHRVDFEHSLYANTSTESRPRNVAVDYYIHL